MFECKFKMTMEDCVTSAKYVYKSQKRKRDKVIAILIPILALCMVAMLVVDIVNHKSIVWDVVLLCALVFLEIVYLIIPLTIISSQKKSYKKNFADMDYLQIIIDDLVCTEILFKNGTEAEKNTHSLKQLTSYIEDANRLVLVFNNIEFICLKKEAISGDLNKLKAHLERIMSKKSKRK